MSDHPTATWHAYLESVRASATLEALAARAAALGAVMAGDDTGVHLSTHDLSDPAHVCAGSLVLAITRARLAATLEGLGMDPDLVEQAGAAAAEFDQASAIAPIYAEHFMAQVDEHHGA